MCSFLIDNIQFYCCLYVQMCDSPTLLSHEKNVHTQMIMTVVSIKPSEPNLFLQFQFSITLCCRDVKMDIFVLIHSYGRAWCKFINRELQLDNHC